jgi:hypothetical protein
MTRLQRRRQVPWGPTPTAPAPEPSESGVDNKADLVGLVREGTTIERRRVFKRWKIADVAGGVNSARIEWRYLDKSQPTANVRLIEVADFGTLGAADWGVTSRGEITAAAITPGTNENVVLSLDVTDAYNTAKAIGLQYFAVKLQYANEDEGVGSGRWYRVGGTGEWAPVLVLTWANGQDLRLELITTKVAVDLGYVDALGDRVAVVQAGTTEFPTLGPSVRLAATIAGLVDDASGTHTGTPSAPIEQGPDIWHFVNRSADEGLGLTPAHLNGGMLTAARARLADWFPLAGGLTEVRDVRELTARLLRSCRAFGYVDQFNREALWAEPIGGTGAAPVRLVRPGEHGAIEAVALLGADGAIDPVSRVEVPYAMDWLGLTRTGWHRHALISSSETVPPDPVRQAQAADAEARYGVRHPGGSQAPADGYEWVPIDRPGVETGIRIAQWQWDQSRARPRPIGIIRVALDLWALGLRLNDELDLESDLFPSALARLLPTTTPFLGSTETGADAYQTRRGRCMVRDLPRLTAEPGADFPVQVGLLLLAWGTP